MPSKTSKIKQKHSWLFEAIGTQWSVDTHTPLTDAYKKTIAEHIERFDAVYSRFRDDSIVGAMERDPGVFDLPNDARQLGELYEKLYTLTSGAMSPLVGVSLSTAGYDQDYSFEVKGQVKAPEWHDVMTWRGSSITTKQPIILDVGAAGKGLLVDEIAELLEKAGVSEYAIDASGDVRLRGETERIGLENPMDPTEIIGIAEVKNMSLCASAINRRTWGNGWHHVLDARTGSPANDVLATWVITDTTMLADGLATALFFVSADVLQSIAPFQYVRLLANGSVEHSEGFVGELYI